jgi:hypothetical protein
MEKKCIICEDNAEFRIKDGREFYCNDCAVMQFGDIALLVKIEEQAKNLKKYLKGEDDIILDIED